MLLCSGLGWPVFPRRSHLRARAVAWCCWSAMGRAAGDADRLFEFWERPGIAHFRQPHNFLALARQVLLDRAPDVLDEVLALGGRENRQYELLPAALQSGDETFVSICARRPLFECALRRAVDAEANITFVASTRVVALLSDTARADCPVRVGGVRTYDGREIRAELVVDALGRGDRGRRPRRSSFRTRRSPRDRPQARRRPAPRQRHAVRNRE
jgi:2-polyprenyl-6-methoxyphenol hydroxylase-like FAD-dependent oxidoreductase